MPTYGYQCTSCETIAEHELPISIDQKAQHPPCVNCGDPCNYVWIPSVPQVILKDGASGSWPSKGNRFKQYRQKQSEAVGKRQRDRYGESKKAIPNYNGQETGTWEEAKYQAVKDKGLEVGPTYDHKIAELKKDKIIV
jgi:hypothetical protein